MASVGSSSQNGPRNPKCTRCRNHGLLNDLKGHKHSCEFRYCNCDKCLIMSEKQQSTAKRIALYRQQLTAPSQSTNDSVPVRCPSTHEAQSPHCSSPPSPEFMTSERRAVAAEIHWQNVRILLYIFPSLDAKALSDLLEENHGNMFVTVLTIAKATMNQADHYISRLNQEAIEYYQNGKDKRLSEADRFVDSSCTTDSNGYMPKQPISPIRTPDSAYNSDSSMPTSHDGRKRPHPSTIPQPIENRSLKSARMMCNYCRLDVERNARFCGNCGKPQ